MKYFSYSTGLTKDGLGEFIIDEKTTWCVPPEKYTGQSECAFFFITGHWQGDIFVIKKIRSAYHYVCRLVVARTGNNGDCRACYNHWHYNRRNKKTYYTKKCLLNLKQGECLSFLRIRGFPLCKEQQDEAEKNGMRFA